MGDLRIARLIWLAILTRITAAEHIEDSIVVEIQGSITTAPVIGVAGASS